MGERGGRWKMGMMVKPAFVKSQNTGSEQQEHVTSKWSFSLKLLDEGEVYTWFNPNMLFYVILSKSPSSIVDHE